MDDTEQFTQRNQKMVEAMARDPMMRQQSRLWFDASFHAEYSYHFRWLGVPIIQYPQDIVAMQELIWEIKPDLVIETGIARGGSLIFYASMLHLLGRGDVLGIDIDIRTHNRTAIESHPMARRITMFEGSSVTDEMAARVREFAAAYRTILLVLDSSHTHSHVLRELELYAPLVTPGSYCVVFDTVIEDMPPGSFPNRPWDVGNNGSSGIPVGRNRAWKCCFGEVEGPMTVTKSEGFLARSYVSIGIAV